MSQAITLIPSSTSTNIISYSKRYRHSLIRTRQTNEAIRNDDASPFEVHMGTRPIGQSCLLCVDYPLEQELSDHSSSSFYLLSKNISFPARLNNELSPSSKERVTNGSNKGGTSSWTNWCLIFPTLVETRGCSHDKFVMLSLCSSTQLPN